MFLDMRETMLATERILWRILSVDTVGRTKRGDLYPTCYKAFAFLLQGHGESLDLI